MSAKARIWSEYHGIFQPARRVWFVQAADAHGPLALDSFEMCVQMLNVAQSNRQFEKAWSVYRWQEK